MHPFPECTIEDIGRFWQILAILSQIYALFCLLFTDLNSAVVHQNIRYGHTNAHPHTRSSLGLYQQTLDMIEWNTGS